jgi:hypothetical protein
MLASNTLYTAVYTRLASALGSVPGYDHTPDLQDIAYPFWVMEDHTAENFDTDDSEGARVTLFIEVWSQYRGLKQVQTSMDAIYNALHKQESNLVLTGGLRVVQALCKTDEIAVSDDGLTRVARMGFEFLIDES